MIPGEDGELAEMSREDAARRYAARTLAGRREPRRLSISEVVCTDVRSPVHIARAGAVE